MNTDQIVVLLISERDRLSKAIEALQGTVKRRGRPPKSLLGLAAVAATPLPAKKRAPWSAGRKKKQREIMRQYWNTRRAAKTAADG